MSDWTFYALPDPWWPFLFIILAGWLPTDIWRYLGVLSSGNLSESSPVLQLVRSIATALVAAVIARLVLYPTGSLALLPDAVRVGAMAGGFLAFLLLRRSIVLGLVVAELILIGGAWVTGAV
ncbi:AzlD domain-containing protein [Aureimonas populi]|uniref:AzlD domain-containing protein n=1 Tax=Aureimonas populi TaxID=1701758 RepID=A0ABW5CRP0_9HYPH|nr:AzlD domain-containing protein [Aureimonas populi]